MKANPSASDLASDGPWARFARRVAACFAPIDAEGLTLPEAPR
jgi:hypothetical protein